jgi:hypothetical protein
MWKLIVVADALPETVFGVAFAGITCFKSIVVTPFAEIAAADAMATPSILSVNVPADPAVFAIRIFVTTAVVDVFGTVYRVVLLVAAAPLNSAFVVVAINYYLQ